MNGAFFFHAANLQCRKPQLGQIILIDDEIRKKKLT